ESGKADRPQSWNRFSYVVNNPLRYIDPDGRQVLAPKSVGERLEANAELREDISKSLIEVPGIGGVLVKVADAILSTIAPSTPEELSANLPGMVVPGAAGFGGSKLLRPLISRIKENPGLVRQAERAGKSAQRELDSLVDQLQRGNLNPGIGNKPIASGILEARARGGARVFFRPNADNIEILGKATKGNQGQVIDLVLDTFGND
ncbi:MAG: hypothetical protein MI919_42365, partial [Holophagales bacterium]|nr:hypothetical protein [Holophagales bacterium]